MLDLEVQAIRLFQHRPRLWSPTRAVSVQPTLASHRPCAVLASLSGLDLLPRRACAARRAQREAERPLRKLGSIVYTYSYCNTWTRYFVSELVASLLLVRVPIVHLPAGRRWRCCLLLLALRCRATPADPAVPGRTSSLRPVPLHGSTSRQVSDREACLQSMVSLHLDECTKPDDL